MMRNFKRTPQDKLGRKTRLTTFGCLRQGGCHVTG